MAPKYDLITITLNSEATLERTLNSVSQQKQLPTRYIFIDGNSTDRTQEIIKKFADKHPEVTVILQPQQGKGISNAWNQALTLIENDLICLLNSDDWYLPDTMDKVLSFFEQERDLQILSGAILYCQDENDSQPLFMEPKPLWKMPLLMPFMHPATFVKKEVYDQIGDFDESLKCSMDYDFMYRALKANCRIKTVNDVYTYMQAGGVANSTRKKARQETRDVALKNGSFFLPWIAFLLRVLTGR